MPRALNNLLIAAGLTVGIIGIAVATLGYFSTVRQPNLFIGSMLEASGILIAIAGFFLRSRRNAHWSGQ